jgi:hypothetical protein
VLLLVQSWWCNDNVIVGPLRDKHLQIVITGGVNLIAEKLRFEDATNSGTGWLHGHAGHIRPDVVDPQALTKVGGKFEDKSSAVRRTRSRVRAKDGACAGQNIIGSCVPADIYLVPRIYSDRLAYGFYNGLANWAESAEYCGVCQLS